MCPAEVRPFRRSDRDQVTALVNAHASAVVPGMSASVSAVLSALERRPGEFIEDPWVSDRVTLVAVQAGRIAASAHLLRYFPDDRAGAAARDAGEIRWLVFWPEVPNGNPCWPDATGAAEALMAACIRLLDQWGVTRQHADGELPVPGVYGVPGQWPHVSALYERVGFRHTGHTEIVYLARVSDLPSPAGTPVPGLLVRRSAGINGTRLSAVLGEDTIGFIEVETLDDSERRTRHGGWADVGNLRVAADYRRQGVATWLLGQAAGWLDLAGIDRLLDYAWLQGTDPGGLDYAAYRAFLPAAGFREITRTRRGWTRADPGSGHR
ncbi:MAG TPA: GNAT family N-acetyltransferase [Streptosporangiaceae bacterium]|nr:GNAT family N-acetyltransferase [Streptosporangiaceae bacterium]